MLILLVLLPLTFALAGPEPVQPGASDTRDHEQVIHGHGPLEMPVCHQGHGHDMAPALPCSHRDAERPTTGDDMAAIPSREPVQEAPSFPGVVSIDALPADGLPSVPVYLLTQRLRI